MGSELDLQHIEAGGRIDGADPDLLSDRALERGRDQLGTLGSGNHFIEVQMVEEIREPKLAQVLGLFPGQVTVTIHTGSRGLGYQVCDDYLRIMLRAAAKYGITLPDRQLCCAPLGSPGGTAVSCRYGLCRQFCVCQSAADYRLGCANRSSRCWGRAPRPCAFPSFTTSATILPSGNAIWWKGFGVGSACTAKAPHAPFPPAIPKFLSVIAPSASRY